MSAKHAIYDELIRSAIGEYIIESCIDVGGQAVVFRVKSIAVDKHYALKVFGLPPNEMRGGSKAVQAGLREAKLQSKVIHRSLLTYNNPYIDSVILKRRKYQVLCIPMELAELGSTEDSPPFADTLRQNPLGQDDLSAIVDLLDALATMHEHGLTHSDIKPANILVFKERISATQRLVLKVTDFGVAKLASAVGSELDGPSGASLGYMAPEQAAGNRLPASDVYSMGASLYYMLTGKSPFSVEPGSEGKFAAWKAVHESAPRPDATQQEMNCHPLLALLLLRMMATDHSLRPTPSECVQEVQSVIKAIDGRGLGYTVPELFNELLEKGFPIKYVPKSTDIFKPEVYQSCGLQLFVVRMAMRHPTAGSYRELLKLFYRFWADSFTIYETWGTKDVTALIWAEKSRMNLFCKQLELQYPRCDLQLYSAKNSYHISPEAPTLDSDDVRPVLALGVQQPVALPDIESVREAYTITKVDALDQKYTRAFTFISSIGGDTVPYVRPLIVNNVRVLMASLSKRQTGGKSVFPWVKVIELKDNAHQMVLLVDYIAEDFRRLADVPTALIERGSEAIRTTTAIETGRISIRSGTILI